MGRRELFHALLGLSLPSASAGFAGEVRAAEDAAPALDVRELVLPGEPNLARRTLVLTPRDVRRGERLPVLVLFHGLGETWDEKVGVRAWAERYGLTSSDARLRTAPLTLPAPSKYLSSERVGSINAALRLKPYRGAILVCPFTPNIHKLPSEPVALDRYARWVTQTLLPAVRAVTPTRDDPSGTAIDGCSLGGYMALEVFLRAPEVFGAVGSVQPAIGEKMAPIYARLIHRAVRRVGSRAIHIETSSWDPELKGSEALSRRLDALSVPNDYVVLPGGHDQLFLRERGTLEMLLWHDRRFVG